jgi:hypothetical protein
MGVGSETPALAEAAALLQDKRLLPPATAAFSDGFHAVVALAALAHEPPMLTPENARHLRHDPSVRPTAADLDDLRHLGQRLISSFLANDVDSPEFPRPRAIERHHIALQYAEAVLRQEEILEAFRDARAEDLPLQTGLSSAERSRVEDFLLYRNLMGRFETLDSLVDGWRRAVSGAEASAASIGHEDVSDHLMGRDSLAAVLDLISPPSRSLLDSPIRSLDMRFFAATRPVSSSIRPCSPWQPQDWWWFRVPSPMGEHFLDRLTVVAPAAADDAVGRNARD